MKFYRQNIVNKCSVNKIKINLDYSSNVQWKQRIWDHYFYFPKFCWILLLKISQNGNSTYFQCDKELKIITTITYHFQYTSMGNKWNHKKKFWKHIYNCWSYIQTWEERICVPHLKIPQGTIKYTNCIQEYNTRNRIPKVLYVTWT